MGLIGEVAPQQRANDTLQIQEGLAEGRVWAPDPADAVLAPDVLLPAPRPPLDLASPPPPDTARPADVHPKRWQLLVLPVVIGVWLTLVLAQDVLWPRSYAPDGWQVLLAPLTWLWVLPLPLGLASVVGMLLPRPRAGAAAGAGPGRVRYVSRGDNVASRRVAARRGGGGPNGAHRRRPAVLPTRGRGRAAGATAALARPRKRRYSFLVSWPQLRHSSSAIGA